MADPAGHGYGPRTHTRIPSSRASKRVANLDPQDAAHGICRICRSEGTPDEPLFYPCRCSGSIRHVHQDCLMEWLSHSQKKYCELCKTPFRFTKFYNPNMPSSLPTDVFIRQVSQYIIEHSFGWFRAIIAIAFWVAGLPWFMRRGWSAMLWLSQESWAGYPGGDAISSGASTMHPSSSMVGPDMCPASPLFAAVETPATDVAGMLSWWANQTVTQFFVHCLCWMVGIPSPAFVSSVSGRVSLFAPPPADPNSILSSVSFLRTLTRNPVFNQELISVLEGQIITVVVIVSFILIILVRDYVVQQQPEINMRGDFEEPEEAAQAPVVVEPARPPYLDEIEGEDSGDEAGSITRHTPQQSVFLEESQAMGMPTTAEQEQQVTNGRLEPLANPTSAGEESAGDGSMPSTRFPQSWEEDISFYRRQSYAGSSDTIPTSEYPRSDAADQGSPSEEPKGKENMSTMLMDNGVGVPSSAPLEDGLARPRAVSDGPRMQGNVNPLANNTWSFATQENHGEQDLSSQPAHASQPAREEDDIGHHSARFLDGDTDSTEDHPERTPLPADIQALHADPSLVQGRPKNLAERVADFMWGDIGDTPQGLPAVLANADSSDDDWLDIPMEPEAPRAIGEDGGDFGLDEDEEDDGIAGIDPEVIEDMEDFEGIMELLGMRGPVTNLFQNVIFCAVLVQAALFTCVFIPFNIGRISFWFSAQPGRLILMLFELSKVTQDVCFVIGGFLSWVTFNLIDMITSPLGGPLASQVLSGRKGSWSFFVGAISRIGSFFEHLSRDLSVPGSGMQLWSAASHEALMSIKQFITASFSWAGGVMSRRGLAITVIGALRVVGDALATAATTFSNPGNWVVDLAPSQAPPVDIQHAYWPAADITWAVLAGYVSISAAAGFYLKTGFRFARGTSLEDWENGVIDTLHQASGILKVITVIGIEMLVFPLYCGILLDCALLPLFAGASMASRLQFTYNNPWTSIFVHWFVGTGYMFHFALFVSMCRKIMRPGVLYFIRDPDDPEFHPVRDVLERNLTTQLRKILFSALVYGALVIVCLGGVVWGLGYLAPNILPIHYSSNEPVLEFPVDLLFYNFFMPLAFRIFKPGDALHAMYSWCFHKSAQILRLTYFLFGERRIDEEGTLQLADNSPYRDYPVYRRAFLGLDDEKRNVIPKSWKDILDGVDAGPESNFAFQQKYLRRRKARLVESGQLIKDGHFVRAPASDRVKIPKGRRVFLDVTESGRRIDGKPDEGLYASDQFRMVYVPPHLLPRTFLFILFIWTFAAVTGVGLTIVPLVIGRMLFKAALPNHIRTNDIYAFCIGIHVLGFVAYSVYHCRHLRRKAQDWMISFSQDGKWHGILHSGGWILRMVYVYTCVLLLCPLALSLLVELYINIPFHTIMNPPSARDFTEATGHGHHKIRIIESWTMGLLYLRLATKLTASFYPHSRFVMAMRAIFRRGWTDPDMRVLTRAFVIPGLLISLLAAFVPGMITSLVEHKFGLVASERDPKAMAEMIIRHRQAYPAVAFFAALARYFMVMKGGFDALKAQVRDDAYLMGERLQNYDGALLDTRTGKTPRPTTLGQGHV